MSGEAPGDDLFGHAVGSEMNETSQFSVQLVEPEGGVAIVDLQGEVDIHTSPEFKRILMPLIEDGRRHIVVDAERVTFMDSTALGVFLSGEKRMRPRGISIVIVCQDTIARLFEITGLDRVFTICRTRDEALRVATARRDSLGAAVAGERGVSRS